MPSDKKRINLTVSEDIYERLAAYRKKNGISSDAGACLQLIVRQLDSLDQSEAMIDMVRKFSHEELKQISDYGVGVFKDLVTKNDEKQ